MKPIDLEGLVPPEPVARPAQSSNRRWNADALERVLNLTKKIPQRDRSWALRRFDLDTQQRKINFKKAQDWLLDTKTRLNGRQEQENEPWLLMLRGNVGNGKTVLGTACFNHLIYHAKAPPLRYLDVYGERKAASQQPAIERAIWRTKSDLWSEYLALLDGDGGGATMRANLMRVSLLMIDDFDLDGTDRMIALFSDVMRNRHLSMKPTIVTTNWTEPMFAEVDEPLTSRLFGNGVTILNFTEGRDRRKS